MILSGKKVRVLTGALMVFESIPFTRTEKRKLSRAEERCLDRIFDEVMSVAEAEYTEIGAGPDDEGDYMVKVKKRLTVSLSREFTTEELKLATEAAAACIAEFGDDKSINVYFGGYEYGIVPADFRKLLADLKSEKATE